MFLAKEFQFYIGNEGAGKASLGICHGCNPHKEALVRGEFNEYTWIRWVRSYWKSFQLRASTM